MDSEGKTPLHWTAVCGNVECTRALISAGADPTLKTAKGETALKIATSRGSTEVAALLFIDQSKRGKLASFAAGHDVLASVLVFLGVIALVAGICNLPFLICVVAAVVGYKQYKNPMTRASVVAFLRDTESHLLSGACAGAMAVLAAAFLLVVLPVISFKSAACVAAAVLGVASAAAYAAVLWMDPGTMHAKVLTQERLEEIVGKGQYLGDLCPTCLIIKPARSKHCSHCKSCIARYGNNKQNK